MVSKYTIAYINHKPEDFSKFLGPSLEKLEGDYSIIKLSDSIKPAINYNQVLASCESPYVIFTHEDISFSSDLLHNIDRTIEQVPNFGVLAAVGANNTGSQVSSKSDQIFEIQTSDASFFIVNSENKLLFDHRTFPDFHLYTEDYCVRLITLLGRKTYTFLHDVNHNGFTSTNGTFLSHWGSTCREIGFCWGSYPYFRQVFNRLWPGFYTT
jgi:hypothetical protein